ncbi:DoxX family protein [Arthrobacter sp. Sr24]
MTRINTVNAWALAALLGASAINHLKNPAFYYPVVPPSLCSDKGDERGVMTRHQWVLVSAVPEALAVAGLLIPRTRNVTAIATTAMFVGFTAGHVSALRRALGPEGTPETKRIHSVRLPLQIPLIAWAWSVRKA